MHKLYSVATENQWMVTIVPKQEKNMKRILTNHKIKNENYGLKKKQGNMPRVIISKLE